MMIVIGAILAIPIAISISNLSLIIIGNTTLGVNNAVTFEFCDIKNCNDFCIIR